MISKVKALLASAMPAKDTPAAEVQDMSEAAVETEGVALASVEEPAWDMDAPVAPEKGAEEQVTPEATAGFEDELSMALKEEVPAQREESENQFIAPSEEKQSDALELPGEVNDFDVQPAVSPTLTGPVEKVIADIAPGIIENVTRELVKDLLGSLRGEIEIAIRKIVPEVAEAIIKKEIEKITSEIK